MLRRTFGSPPIFSTIPNEQGRASKLDRRESSRIVEDDSRSLCGFLCPFHTRFGPTRWYRCAGDQRASVFPRPGCTQRQPGETKHATAGCRAAPRHSHRNHLTAVSLPASDADCSPAVFRAVDCPLRLCDAFACYEDDSGWSPTICKYHTKKCRENTVKNICETWLRVKSWMN